MEAQRMMDWATREKDRAELITALYVERRK